MKYTWNFLYNLDRRDRCLGYLTRAVDSIRDAVPTENIHLWAEGGPSATPIEGVTHHSLPDVGQVAAWNLILHSCRGDDANILMHDDALCEPGAAKRYLDFVAKIVEDRSRWGAIMSRYDVLVAYNLKMVEDIGYMDTKFWQYGVDADYYVRMGLRDWKIVESCPDEQGNRIDPVRNQFDPEWGEYDTHPSGVRHYLGQKTRFRHYLEHSLGPHVEDLFYRKWGCRQFIEADHKPVFAKPFEREFPTGVLFTAHEVTAEKFTQGALEK